MKFTIVFLILLLINNILISFYCTFAKKAEEYILQKKSPDYVNNGCSRVRRKYVSGIVFLYVKTYSYLYGWVRYCSILVGFLPSNSLRKLLYKYVFKMKLDRKTSISGGCEFRSPWNIKLGACTIQEKCIFDGRSGIIVGDNVVFGIGVHIWTQQHDLNDSYFDVNENNCGMVVISDYAWICSDSSILPKVTVNKGAVLGSKALATKTLEEYGVYVGIPAQKIADRNRDLRYQLSGRPHWHFY